MKKGLTIVSPFSFYGGGSKKGVNSRSYFGAGKVEALCLRCLVYPEPGRRSQIYGSSDCQVKFYYVVAQSIEMLHDTA